VPSTVADVFAAAGVEPAGVVRWGSPPTAPPPGTRGGTGIYAVALTETVDSLGGAIVAAPLSLAAIDELLSVRPELTLDGRRPTREDLYERLARFWLPDEVIVYIGLAGQRTNRPAHGEVAKRVCDYYATPLGARSPHAGGWPLKTLRCLDEVYVHYAYCDQVQATEDACIAHFAKHVSESTRVGLHDSTRLMPFANLEFPKGNFKNHGIRGARAPRVRRESAATTTASRRRPPTAPPSVSPHYRSQNVTAKDIAVGQIRIPGATKRLLPPTRQDITVVLRGRPLTCRWDPRYGDKERSGVIRVGKAAAVDLLSPGDVLAVSTAADGSVALE